MASIKSKNTTPEILVRKELFKRGFRYRINDKKLIGSPDIVLPKYHSVIFIHGCFWHGHSGCKMATLPTTNTVFWQTKISKNKERDEKVRTELKRLGWHVLTIWSCELKSKADIHSTVDKMLLKLEM